MSLEARDPKTAPSWYRSQFEEFERTLNGQKNSDLHSIRREALARFESLGFPTTKDEEWKFTDVAPIARAQFSPAAGIAAPPDAASLAPWLFDDAVARLVFVNGRFVRELSIVDGLPKGVTAGDLASAIGSKSDTISKYLAKEAGFESNAFTALNTAFARDGAYCVVDPLTVCEKPIHCLYLAMDTPGGAPVIQPRNLVVVGAGAQVTIVEQYVGLGSAPDFTNTVTEMVVGENAVARHVTVQIQGASSFHVGRLQLRQQKNSSLLAGSVSVGGSLVRNDVAAILEGEGAECTLDGLSLAAGTQHVDNHTLIDHALPHCNSFELYKGIFDGRARGVFNGKILVRQDAQKTDARQTNKNLILSDTAAIDTKPQLEIYANDVRCTHGATIGQLDEEALFYLRARGIGRREAREILITAFAGDVIDRIAPASVNEAAGTRRSLREYILNLIAGRLDKFGKGERQ
jgi:Fe-S cluster assembly protein SufD